MDWSLEKKVKHTCELSEMGVNDTDLRHYIKDWITHEVNRVERMVAKVKGARDVILKLKEEIK